MASQLRRSIASHLLFDEPPVRGGISVTSGLRHRPWSAWLAQNYFGHPPTALRGYRMGTIATYRSSTVVSASASQCTRREGGCVNGQNAGYHLGSSLQQSWCSRHELGSDEPRARIGSGFLDLYRSIRWATPRHPLYGPVARWHSFLSSGSHASEVQEFEGESSRDPDHRVQSLGTWIGCHG